MEQKSIKQTKLRGKRRNRTNESYRSVPNLTINGLWLEQAGFCIGQPVKIAIEIGKLTIIAL